VIPPQTTPAFVLNRNVSCRSELQDRVLVDLTVAMKSVKLEDDVSPVMILESVDGGASKLQVATTSFDAKCYFIHIVKHRLEY